MKSLFASAFLAATALPALATTPGYTPLSGADPVGRIYDYTRSNRDGSLPEHIVVYRKSVTEVAVFKAIDPCTTAAYVTSVLDPQTLEATTLYAGKLNRDGTQRVFGRMDLDPATRVITAKIDLPDAQLSDTATAPDAPWHLYDYDLATLTVTLPHLTDPKADFSIGMALVVTDDMSDFLTYMGRTDVRYVGEETRKGQATRRYDVGGLAFGNKGGPLWLDAKNGHIVDAEFGIPNHAEYADFKLKLNRVSDGGEAEWNSLLRAHYTGCPR
ncbi:hypothetical protein ABI_41200 [Asticcacaulis biprosthecium C19]|uniref:Uncharacterized protein n=1 Tax=Asticcacaulis biprosthecium C19 TaxID=715226 RepID=F4QSH7_9CAUL|nr:hypothetical protein [Asticcacaulis biprosthecium]EGF89697.1 hypothetical protein ABI_41200 [Asticcacaulis biprosthecium C19]